jgi:hypothetical protein
MPSSIDYARAFRLHEFAFSEGDSCDWCGQGPGTEGDVGMEVGVGVQGTGAAYHLRCIQEFAGAVYAQYYAWGAKARSKGSASPLDLYSQVRRK